MAGLMSRGAVLTASRLSNFAIQLLGPLLLVRILEVESYGRYQEFMIYGAVLTALCSFSVDSSLTYFLPRFPEREKAFVSQTTLVTLSVSSICLFTLVLARPFLLNFATYDFFVPLAAYVFFFVNLNWIDYYWIAKRRPQLVLYYSASRLLVRITVLLLVAYLTRDVFSIFWSMVAVEALRVLLAAVYFLRRRVFVRDIRRSEIAEQLKFAAPIGAAALVQQAGRNIGKLFIGSTLGPAALAYYAVGSYLQPIVRVMRSGIEDAVYPELVRAHDQPDGPLRLWQRVNVLNCVMFFPAFVVLVYHAEPIVTTLFTAEYLPAVAVFQVYALFLLRRCFNTDVLLRTTGRTGFMLWGAIGALVGNVLLIAILARSVGMLGPAIAFMAAEVGLELYFALQARRALRLRLVDLADWRSIYRVIASCIAASPILVGFEMLPGPMLLRLALGSLLYFAAALYLAYRLGVSDVARVVRFALSKLRKPARR